MAKQKYSQRGGRGWRLRLGRPALGNCPGWETVWAAGAQTGAPRLLSCGSGRPTSPEPRILWTRFQPAVEPHSHFRRASSDPSSARAQRHSFPEGAWQLDAIFAPARPSAGSAGEGLWVTVAQFVVSRPGHSSRLTAASRRVPESLAGCGEVRAPEPPPASPQCAAGGGAGWRRVRPAPTPGPCLPQGPAGRPGRCAIGIPDPTAGRARPGAHWPGKSAAVAAAASVAEMPVSAPAAFSF